MVESSRRTRNRANKDRAGSIQTMGAAQALEGFSVQVRLFSSATLALKRAPASLAAGPSRRSPACSEVGLSSFPGMAPTRSKSTRGTPPWPNKSQDSDPKAECRTTYLVRFSTLVMVVCIR